MQFPFGFAPWHKQRHSGWHVLTWLALTVVCVWIFQQLNNWEVEVSRLFTIPRDCDTRYGFNPNAEYCSFFQLQHSLTFLSIRRAVNLIPIGVMVASFLWYLKIALSPSPNKGQKLIAPAIGWVSFLLGPVFLVNIFLKELSGRPRPFQTVEFGGFFEYREAGTWFGECMSNCSFVSGDVASSMWMLWVVPCLPAKYRKLACCAVILLTLTIAFGRVVIGRHYVSDVSIAALTSILTLVFVSWLTNTPFGQRVVAGSARFWDGMERKA